MGKRGPKARFNEVTCPNPDYTNYGIKGKGNVTGNGTYGTKSGRVRKYICPSLIERLNLTLRQDNNRLSRKTIGFSKKIEKLDASMILYFANFNFCRAHGSLKHRNSCGKVSMNCHAKGYGSIDHN